MSESTQRTPSPPYYTAHTDANIEDAANKPVARPYPLHPPTLNSESLRNLLQKLEEGGFVYRNSDDAISVALLKKAGMQDTIANAGNKANENFVKVNVTGLPFGSMETPDRCPDEWDLSDEPIPATDVSDWGWPPLAMGDDAAVWLTVRRGSNPPRSGVVVINLAIKPLVKDVLASILSCTQPGLAGALKTLGKMKEEDATVATALVPRDWTEERSPIRDGFRELGTLDSVDPTARMEKAEPSPERDRFMRMNLAVENMGLPLYILYVWDTVS